MIYEVGTKLNSSVDPKLDGLTVTHAVSKPTIDGHTGEIVTPKGVNWTYTLSDETLLFEDNGVIWGKITPDGKGIQFSPNPWTYVNLK